MLSGNEAFPLGNLGPESISATPSTFAVGDILTLHASQDRYSFYYYEIYAPNKLINSGKWRLESSNVAISFDPDTQVQINAAEHHTGTNSKIRARYRV
jgi:hypothetical protein